MKACLECMSLTKKDECCSVMTLNKKQLKGHLEMVKKSPDWKSVGAIERLLKQMDE